LGVIRSSYQWTRFGEIREAGVTGAFQGTMYVSGRGSGQGREWRIARAV